MHKLLTDLVGAQTEKPEKKPLSGQALTELHKAEMVLFTPEASLAEHVAAAEIVDNWKKHRVVGKLDQEAIDKQTKQLDEYRNNPDADRYKPMGAMHEWLLSVMEREDFFRRQEGGQRKFPNPAYDKLDEMLNNGQIKEDAAAKIIPANNGLEIIEGDPAYERIMREENGDEIWEAYQRGVEKIKKNKRLATKPTSEMDPDVYTVVRFMPVQVFLYDKEVTKEEQTKGTFTLSDEELENPLADFFMVTPKDLQGADYVAMSESRDREIAELEEAWFKTVKNKYSHTGAKNTNEYKLAKNLHEQEKAEIEDKYNSALNNSATITEYKKSLIHNMMTPNKASELLLRVGHVMNGNLQNYKKEPGKGVPENSLKDLVGDRDIEMDELFFTNKDGRYEQLKRQEGSTKKLPLQPEHPFYRLASGTTGKLFLMYTAKSGTKVPIKLNTRRLSGPENIPQLLYDVLEWYFNEVEKGSPDVNKIRVPKEIYESHPFAKMLPGRPYTAHQFIELFMQQHKGNTPDETGVSNTFVLRQKDGVPIFQLTQGETQAFKIDSVKALEANKNNLLGKLGNTFFYFNYKMYMNEKGVLNRNMFNYLIDQKLINHDKQTEENFDKVFDPSSNKGFMLTRVDYKPETQDAKDKKTFGKMLKAWREGFRGNSRNAKKYGVNTIAMTSSIRDEVVRKVSAKLRGENRRVANEKLAEDDKLTLDQHIADAVREVIEIHKNELAEIGDLYPAEMQEGRLLKMNLDMLDFMEKEVFGDKRMITNIKNIMKIKSARFDLVTFFKGDDTDVGIDVMTFTETGEAKQGTNAVHNFTSKEEANKFIETMRVLSTINNLYNFMHIRYAEDYPNNPGTPNEWQYDLDVKHKVANEERSKGFFKSQLKEVVIKGKPVASEYTDPDTGETTVRITGGSIYFVTSDKVEDKKTGKVQNASRSRSEVQVLYDENDSNSRIATPNVVTKMFFPAEMFDENMEFNLDEIAKLRKRANQLKELKELFDSSVRKKANVQIKNGTFSKEFMDDKLDPEREVTEDELGEGEGEDILGGITSDTERKKKEKKPTKKQKTIEDIDKEEDDETENTEDTEEESDDTPTGTMSDRASEYVRGDSFIFIDMFEGNAANDTDATDAHIREFAEEENLSPQDVYEVYRTFFKDSTHEEANELLKRIFETDNDFEDTISC